MLSRRLMGRVRRVSSPPSVANLIAQGLPPVDARPDMALVVATSSGSPDVIGIPDIHVANISGVYGSHQHGTITIQGRSADGVEPDLSDAPTVHDVSIFPCSGSGIPSTPLERLPFPPTIAPSLVGDLRYLVRDFAAVVDGANIKLQSLRTGASRTLADSSNRRLFHGGSSLVVGRRIFGNSTATPAQQGLTRTRANTSSPYRLQVATSISEPDCIRCTSYTDEDVVPWSLCRSEADVHVRRTAALNISTTLPARRYGSNWMMVTVVCCEVHHTTPGAPFTSGGLTLQAVDLTIVLSRRNGILRIFPDGTASFMALFEERYQETGTAWRSGTTQFYKPGLTDWPTLSMPLTTVLDLPRPATEFARLWPLADRLVSALSGQVRGWSYDGIHLGDHAFSGSLRGSLGGESVLTTFSHFSRNAGATWTALDSGVTVVNPQDVTTLRLF